MSRLSAMIRWGILLACLLVQQSAEAKPRFITLKEELDEASVITPARILAYEPEGLRFQPLPELTRPFPELARPTIAHYADDPSWSATPVSVEEYGAVLGGHAMTGTWPPVGAPVLIVVDARGIVSLFAWQLDDAYRLWSPHMTGSVALFECQPPAEPLGLDAVGLSEEEQPHTTVALPDHQRWDGCLMPISAVVSRGVESSSAAEGLSCHLKATPQIVAQGQDLSLEFQLTNTSQRKLRVMRYQQPQHVVYSYTDIRWFADNGERGVIELSEGFGQSERLVDGVSLDPGASTQFPIIIPASRHRLGQGNYRGVYTLTVVYEPDPAGAQAGYWVGRLESHPIHILVE